MKVTKMSNSIEQAIEQIKSEVRVDSEGKATFSIRAVARLGDKDHTTLVKSLKTGGESEPSKIAEKLIQQGFEGGELTQFSETGIPDVAVAIILEYWAFDSPKPSKQAQIIYRAFAAIGIRVWAQQLVGWREVEDELTLRQILVAQMPKKPKAWEIRFKPHFWLALEQCYGMKQGSRGCANFISHWVYKWFPGDVQDRIDEINPFTDDSCQHRERLIHTHFDLVLQELLVKQIDKVTENLLLADNKIEFKDLMKDVPKITLHQITKLSLRKEKIGKMIAESRKYN